MHWTRESSSSLMAGFVGLDIGTMAVRAAEVSFKGNVPTLELFGQVALPYGAVRNGEVVDVGAVGEAIQRLWSQTGFKTKKVVVGVSNQRVFVRQAELSAMTEEEIRSSLQFEAQEFIPIPIEDVELDFRVIENIVGADGEPRVRILLAAAQKDMIANLIGAVELAGLRVSKIDLIPFALVRALAPLSYGQHGEGSSYAEAIISIGAGITNVVVHEQGVPRFVRVVSMGGSSVTEAIAEGLGVDLDTAEELKRYSYMRPSDPQSAKVAEIVSAQIRPLLQEIQGSIQFYTSQADAAPLARILVAGGGSLTPGLFDSLTAQSESPVQPALILGAIQLGRTGLSEQDLTRSEPVMAPALGLALAPHDPGAISLVPRDFAPRANQGAQLVAVAAILLVILALFLYIWHSKDAQISKLKHDNAALSSENAKISASLPELKTEQELASQNSQQETMIKQILSNDIDWVNLLGGIAQVMPQSTWINTLTIQQTATASSGAASAPSSSTGANSSASLATVTIQVLGFDIESAAQWMEAFSSYPSISGMWLGSIKLNAIPDQWTNPNPTTSNSTSSSNTSSSPASATQSTGIGVPNPNGDPSNTLCIIPGHCYAEFTSTAGITSAAVSTRVGCYLNGFSSATCPFSGNIEGQG